MKKHLLCSLAALAVGASALEIPALPLENWQVKPVSEAQVELKNNGSALVLDYQTTPQQMTRNAQISYRVSRIDLLLKNPVKLTEETERIFYEASGLVLKGSLQVLLEAILRDAEGELLYYQPTDYPHLRSGSSKWGCWITSNFYAGEAGGASQDTYYTDGSGNNRPDGQLEFLGFRVTVRQELRAGMESSTAPQPRKGTVMIGEIRTAGRKLAYQDPFLYADNIFKKAGNYCLTAQIRNEFQGTPVREFKQDIQFDPAKADSAKQKLIFPLGPDDHYWIEYKINDHSGQAVDGGEIQHQVLFNTDKTPLTPINAKLPPPAGILRLNEDHPGRGVYRRSEPLKLNARLFPQAAGALKIDWKLRAYLYGDLLDQGSQTVDCPDAAVQDIFIAPKTSADRDSYRFEVEISSGGKVLEKRSYLCGFVSDSAQRLERAGRVFNRHELKKHSYNRTTYLTPRHRKLVSEEDARNDFIAYLDQSRQMATDITVLISLPDFEVLPGVYDFTDLDMMMECAADYGCKLTVRLSQADENQLYRWPKASRQYNYDQTVILTRHYGGYAVSDPALNELWLNAYRTLFNRYRNHVAFQGYYIMLPAGEYTVLDRPWAGQIAGYSPVLAAGFREFLRDNLKYSLDDLNRRWGTNYKSFDEVEAPQPTLRNGAKPDLRMQWIDFCRVKSLLGSHYWFPKAIDSIRQYDNDRVTIVYGHPRTFTHLSGKLDYCHNGGNHSIENLGAFTQAWQKHQIGWITEPHHPHRWAADNGDHSVRGWVLDFSVWIMLAQAGGGGANLHVYYYPNPAMELDKHYGNTYAYDRFQRFRPILEELRTLELVNPPTQVATLHDPYTLYAKHRAIYVHRLYDLGRWLELVRNDAVPTEKFQEENKDNYKLYVPNLIDEVISLDSLNTLDSAVRGGARLLIGANTGKYVPELGSEPFQLLKKLGIQAPATDWQMRGKQVEATVGTDNPLFTAGRKLVFQTGERLHEQLQSEEVRKKFLGFAYRWIPETDYFGYYPGHQITGGKVLATFPDGGAAMSLHRVGKGEVIVFWGTPDMSNEQLAGMMKNAAAWAGVDNPRQDSPVALITEGKSESLKRHYALLYQLKAGKYRQKIQSVPDGNWFVDDPLSEYKYGIYTGKELRENGIELEWCDGNTPLKILRMIPENQMSAVWSKLYRR